MLRKCLESLPPVPVGYPRCHINYISGHPPFKSCTLPKNTSKVLTTCLASGHELSNPTSTTKKSIKSIPSTSATLTIATLSPPVGYWI
ncbi:unnamed protein product [Rhizophagus irregularis]|nr:unnamed protein product [Rhizophagus irregularis]